MQKEILISDEEKLDELYLSLKQLLLKMNKAQVIEGKCLNGIKIKVGVAFETDETMFNIDKINLTKTVENLSKLPPSLTKAQFWDAIALYPLTKNF